MFKHHNDLILCRKITGPYIGKLCEKCEGRCVICDSYVRPTEKVRICNECNFSKENKCIICNNNITQKNELLCDAYYCKNCVIMEKDRDGCPVIINIGKAKTDIHYEKKRVDYIN